jgi:hypothetical protein
MSLGKRLIQTGAAACLTETTDIFGDSSGKALYSLDFDSSDTSGTFNGEPYNGVNFGVSGKINTGARFNGTNQFIELGSNVFKYTDVTISAFINPNLSDTNVKTIFGNTSYVNGQSFHGIIISVKNDGSSDKIFVQHYPSGTAVSSTGSISLNTFTHIAVSYTGSQTKIYINGSLDSTHSATLSYSASQTLTASLGAYILHDYTSDTTYDEFSGTIDQVRVFSSILNGTQISTLAAETACVHTSTTDDNDFPVTNAAYYKLNNSAEDSKGTNDGTETNIEYRFGRYGQAAVFNGSSSKITLPSGFLDSSTTLSFSLWVNPSSFVNFTGVLDKYIGSTSGWALDVPSSSSRLPRIVVYDGANKNVSATTALTLGNWTHIAGTISTSEMKIYVNGSLEGTTSISTMITNTTPLVIGGDGVSTLAFNGSIDQVRIFSTTLTSDQVSQLYNEKPETDTSNFKAVLYKGTGATQYISNVGMDLETSGGLVWIKNRDQEDSHALVDNVRGIATTGSNYIASDATTQEASSTNMPSSLEKNGFFVQGSGGRTNTSSEDYVAWNWKAAGTAVNIGVNSITGSTPSIASDVSANTAAGFSIVSFTNGSSGTSTIGHGLSSAPQLILMKQTDGTTNWVVYSEAGGAGRTLILNENFAFSADNASVQWGSVPTSSLFTVTNNSSLTNASKPHIAYCFHSVSGYSKISTYSGSGVSGKEITLDFNPSFVLIKRTNATAGWVIVDDKRGTKELYPHLNNAEDTTTTSIVLGANKFTLNSTGTWYNASGGTYIYMAFK